MVTFQYSIHFMENDQMVPNGQEVGGTHGRGKEVEAEMSDQARNQNLGHAANY